MNKFHFSTVVSQSHVFKFIVMYNTLTYHCNDFRLFALCVDEKTYKILKDMNYHNVTLIQLHEVEDEELLRAKSNRIYHEYCWTLKPVVLYYIMCNFPTAQYYAHLDADLCFFSNPELIFQEAPNASLYITEHHNSNRFMHYYNLTGRYNTGFVGCKKDDIALSAIGWWKNKCIEKCSVEMDVINKTFGDQRYVEVWPTLFQNVHVVNTIGANAALWNIERYNVSHRNREVYVNNNPLIFYHFSGFCILSPKEFNLCHYYHINDKKVVKLIYLPYMILLSEAIKKIKEGYPNFSSGFSKRNVVPNMHYYRLK
ncbi:hypothetical protein [Crassaminicella profunda]|uniref:hypothetical protein n=1 Tax=Crassaminicella profunda TaxID=1286698 RepID=UPI001CA62029|nr:hypothetical protein [Crassaminicella profunda]QZY57018.1 hypothetical protein K7H06_08900 [Crassaminicella profunda]